MKKKEKKRKGKEKKIFNNKKKISFSTFVKRNQIYKKIPLDNFCRFFFFLFRSGKFFTNLHSHTHTHTDSHTHYYWLIWSILIHALFTRLSLCFFYFTLLSKKRIKYSFFLCLSYYQDIIFDFTIDVRIPDFHGDNNYNNQKKKIDQFDWWRMILVLLLASKFWYLCSSIFFDFLLPPHNLYLTSHPHSNEHYKKLVTLSPKVFVR